MKNYNISVQRPETDILVDDQLAYHGMDPLNKIGSLDSRSQISTAPKMSNLHSAADEFNKLSLFPKGDDVPTSSRSSRRRSIPDDCIQLLIWKVLAGSVTPASYYH